MAEEGLPDSGCPFDKLSDELLQHILERACKWNFCLPVWKLPKLAGDGCWVSARKLNQLSSVCQRFRQLNAAETAKHVIWAFQKAGTPMVGVAAVSQTGEHLRSLAMHYIQRDETRELAQASASIELLTAVLRQSTNLSTFVLVDNRLPQSEEASQQLWKLVGGLPLRRFWLVDSGFSCLERLRSTLRFRHLVELKVKSTSISDQFVSSLLLQAPVLETLCLKACTGLEEPAFKSSSLKDLSLHLNLVYDLRSGAVVVDAPNLRSLMGVPKLRLLRLHAPLLGRLGLLGPAEVIEPENLRFDLSELKIEGKKWRMAQVEGLRHKFRPSEKLKLEFDMEYWAEDSEARCLSTFLQKVPPALIWWKVSTATSQLYLGESCTQKLRSIRFDLLKYVHFTMKTREDFKVIISLLGCCPNLEKIGIDLRHLESPVDKFATRIVELQKAYSHADISFEEPPFFVNSGHLLEVAEMGQEEMNALLQECWPPSWHRVF